MGRIQVLSDHLIDRIAAGEVVERPASVVKELLENSLDAQAGRLEILLEGGGKRRIRIRDDGIGMDRDDALLAVERHATSKILRAEDLNAIRSLGFRGEALSSIAAVSRFTLSTATGEGAGTEVRVVGGRIESVREIGLPRGTSVEIARLFFNVPARRKFLRADATELAQIVRIVTRYALAFPAIRFLLEQDGRRFIDVAPTEARTERIGQIYGRDLAAKLLPFDLDVEGIRINGLAGRPVDAWPRRDGQHLFVNGRAVQDRVLNHAVAEAYANTMARGRFATLFLFVELDPQDVDVNVHPQKHEVRFRQSSRVHDLVRDAIAGSLRGEVAVPRMSDLRPSSWPAEQSGVARAAVEFLEAREPRPGVESQGYVPPAPATADRAVDSGAAADLIDVIHRAEPHQPARRAVPLAQYRDSYIIAQDAEGLVLVDQHAAHERVLFETYLSQAEQDHVETQDLMFPLTIELAPHERLLLEAEQAEFRRLGFRFESFGEQAVRLDGVPAIAGESEPESLLRELLGEASHARSARADLDGLRHRLVTTAACHAAIKVNYPLQLDSMQRLLDDLFGLVNPTTCPHGRPVLFRLGLDQIERTFRRK